MTIKTITWETCRVKLGDLEEWDANPRRSTEKESERIKQSIEKFGYSQLVEIEPGKDGKFVLVDGHQRKPVMLMMQGYGPDAEIEARLSSRKLTKQERKEYIALKHQGAIGEWDPEKMLELYGTDELLDWGFETDDLLKMGFEFDEPESKDAAPQIDRAAELLEKWQVKTGDLWQIGAHRLICGDCTDLAVVERVMGGEKADMTWIDPPYNALKSWNKDEAHSETRLDPSDWFENDNMEWDDYWKFIEKVFAGLQGHSAYVCCDFRIYDGFKPRLEQAGYKVKHCIVWKKNVWGLGERYRFQHEFIIYACRQDAPFYGGHSESDVWEVDAVRGANVDHNTPKPVGLPYKAMQCSTIDNNIVYDGFCGSGTSLVACENLQRKGRAVEKEPKHVAVTLQRMQDAFGITGVRIE